MKPRWSVTDTVIWTLFIAAGTLASLILQSFQLWVLIMFMTCVGILITNEEWR